MQIELDLDHTVPLSPFLVQETLLHLFIGEVKYMIGGRQGNPVHILRQLVLRRGDTGLDVEFILQARGLAALRPKLVHRHLVAAHAVSELGEELRLLEQVAPGKDAEAHVLQGGHLQLGFAGQVALTFAGQRRHLGAGAVAVARGMIAALGGHGEGDAVALQGAGIVAREGLAFRHGQIVYSEHLARGLDAVADHAADRRGGLDLVQQLHEALLVAELGHPCFRGNTQGGAGLDGVQTQIVYLVIQAGNAVQAAQAQVGAQQGQILILNGGADGFSAFVGKDGQALDHAAVHAGLACLALAAAGLDELDHLLAADLGVLVESAQREVAGGTQPQLVDNFEHACGAVELVALFDGGHGLDEHLVIFLRSLGKNSLVEVFQLRSRWPE